MPDSEISNLPAVVTPVSTDEMATAQAGASKKVTRAQVHTLESGEQLLLPSGGSSSAPTVKFGASGNGFHEASNILSFDASGVIQFQLFNGFLSSWGANGAKLKSGPATATVPFVMPAADDNTGIGRAAADQLSHIAGGVEGHRVSEASSAVLQAYQADVGLTAHTDSVQGAGIILSSYNVYSTVANAGDAATLPAVFTAGPSTLVHIKNDGANSMDVFPASGDDAGAGTDTAVAVAAGDFAVFMGTVANSTWTKIMGGTA